MKLFICFVLFLFAEARGGGDNETSASSDSSSPDDERELRELEWEDDISPSSWSGWSTWSPCSRTCDGGASYQLRHCNALAGCRGASVQYKICNMQPCPDAVEFREHQCSAYNSMPYGGELYTWTPHYDYDIPCVLTCKSHTGIIAQLATSVRDGTRCRPGSLDMCIDGKCQRVGCDLEIGSTRKVDDCGVCGGDGSSCSLPLYSWMIAPVSLCTVTCGGGFKMSQATCRNKVTGDEVDPKLCNLAQQPEAQIVECNTHRCPPKWQTEEWERCSVSCGGGTKQRVVICTEEANGTRSKVPDHFCRGHKPRMLEPCNTTPCPPTWTAGEWSGCSVSCGEGIQTRNVSCLISRYEKPGSVSCIDETRPSQIQHCSTGISCPDDSETLPDLDESLPLLHPYPPFKPTAERLVGEPSSSSSEPNFVADAWGPCSVTCGEGMKTRVVTCKIYLDFSRTYATLPDQKCQGPKPVDKERCVEAPCALSNRMDTIQDSFLERSYADTYRSGGYSDSNIKVAPGTTNATYTWKEKGFSHCSASCLGGVQELLIMCIRESDVKVVSPFLCSHETRPEALIRTCNDQPCPPRWNHSDFSTCTKSCGIGIQTRDINCIHEVTRGNTIVVPNHMCPQPPPSERQYCNVLDCPVKWHTGEWSKCSKSCGGGEKRRTVDCKQVMAQNHVVGRPKAMCPPGQPKSTRPCNTKPCAYEDLHPIAISNNTYIQQNPSEKKVALKIGGQAQVFYGTQVKIKCPVKKFNRTKIHWAKDHKVLSNSKKYRISKKGALRIQDVTYHDSGVFTCLAGRSSADLALTVKPRPGEFPSSEEIERQHHNQLDPAMRINGEMPGRPFLAPGNDMSHELQPGDGLPIMTKKPPRPTIPPHMAQPEVHTNILPQHHSGTTIGSRYDQTLWPFQSFGNSRGHRMVMEEAVPPSTVKDYGDYESTTEAEESSIVVLGKGDPENLKFDWMISEWSPCSHSCGGNGYQKRAAHCMVGLNNVTRNVDSNLCVDAGLFTPITIQKCGVEMCPHWVPGEWTSCHESRCFTWNTAMQRRDVSCQASNSSDVEVEHCNEIERPTQRQECYNDKCKGTWKVGEWSECAAPCDAQGVKYRILQCVWYGTKKPAGNACRDQPRPSVMKVCKGPPCSDMSECIDESKYCENVRAMNMCRMQRYQTQCCYSCRNK